MAKTDDHSTLPLFINAESKGYAFSKCLTLYISLSVHAMCDINNKI